MKIVMCYNISDYECSADFNLCFEYESIEAAYSDFVDLCRKTKKEYENYLTKIDNIKKEKDWIKKYREIQRINQEFIFCNCEFNYTNFCGMNYDIQKEFENFPEFFELNDWFEKTRIDK